MNDLVKTFNPANASALNSNDLDRLRNLTNDEIKTLALSYPNRITGSRAYLLIVDSKKPIAKQIPTLSTFENLYNLRSKNGMGSFVAVNFRDNISKNIKAVNVIRPKRTEVVDLSDQELLTLPGFKTLDEQKVSVTKIKEKNANPSAKTPE